MLFDYSSAFHSKTNSSGKSEAKASLKARLVILNSQKKIKTPALKSLTKKQIEEFKDQKISFVLDCSNNSLVAYVAPKLSLKLSAKQLSEYAPYRDDVGAALRAILAKKPDSISVEFEDISEDAFVGAMVGIELATYSFVDRSKELPKFAFDYSVNPELLEKSLAIGKATQVARHLVNLPPNRLNPKTFADLCKSEFKKSKGWTSEVWDEARLKKEGMNLHVAVGNGANEKSCLAILKYRHKSAQHHVALVGKGITFDSGGLDIKPSSGMRLMKKDMGGAAAVFGTALWAKDCAPELNIDFYLCLAENSIDEDAFRPGDIYQGRNGKTVEISNTDAEGRLVLADTLTLASEILAEIEMPSQIINVATLTGAGKVALGPDLASLFSNNDDLAHSLQNAGDISGDLCWQMPLHQPYNSYMKSSFADLENSASTGYGGAITAALFLENFVKHPAWAHLDIYAWKDSAGGVYADKGGSGQGVQLLIRHLDALTQIKTTQTKSNVTKKGTKKSV